MTLAILTTPIARYSVPEHLVKFWRERVTAGDDSTLDIYNALGERMQSHGALFVVPAIWTHVPVPLGFPIEAIHERFERRAAVVLGELATTFLKCTPDGNYLNKDNRYYCDGMRMAWMMYLDLAISQRQ